MEPNSDTANTPPADNTPAEPATPVVMPANPNELATELTQEQEQELVNKTLGIKEATNDKPEPTSEPPVPTTPTGEPEVPAPAQPDKPENPEPPAQEPKAAEEKPPEPAAELSQPQTDDLWIEVKDSEGKDVKLVYDPANPNSFLPEGFTFKDDNQLFSILDAKAEMADIYKGRVSEFDTKTAEAEEQETTRQNETDTKAGWDAEIQDLIDGGMLEQPKAKVGDTNFLEDPTVQKVDAVFKFMAAENTTRREENKPLLRSFGTAFNLYNKNSEAAAEEAKKKADNEMAKARGALVGSTSAPATGTETPVYKRGSASNIWQVKIPE